jgi:hypothetical protein
LQRPKPTATEQQVLRNSHAREIDTVRYRITQIETDANVGEDKTYWSRQLHAACDQASSNTRNAAPYGRKAFTADSLLKSGAIQLQIAIDLCAI